MSEQSLFKPLKVRNLLRNNLKQTVKRNIMRGVEIKKKKRFKLKKKWRFWRLFKNFFLTKKKSDFFVKLKMFFNYKRVVVKQYNVLYNLGKSNNYNFFSKYFGGVKFMKVLTQLEMRFSVVILRLFFVKNIKQAEMLIKKKKIFINNTFKNFKYTLKPKDLIRKISYIHYKSFFTLYFEKKYSHFMFNNNFYLDPNFFEPYSLWLKKKCVKPYTQYRLRFGKLLFNIWNTTFKSKVMLFVKLKKPKYIKWVNTLIATFKIQESLLSSRYKFKNLIFLNTGNFKKWHIQLNPFKKKITKQKGRINQIFNKVLNNKAKLTTKLIQMLAVKKLKYITVKKIYCKKYFITRSVINKYYRWNKKLFRVKFTNKLKWKVKQKQIKNNNLLKWKRKKKYRGFHWLKRRVKRPFIKKYYTYLPFRFLKRNNSVNYFHIRYPMWLIFLLRYPLMGEFLINRSTKMVSWSLFKKFYSLY